jgi:hypothetical protein
MLSGVLFFSHLMSCKTDDLMPMKKPQEVYVPKGIQLKLIRQDKRSLSILIFVYVTPLFTMSYPDDTPIFHFGVRSMLPETERVFVEKVFSRLLLA